MRWWLLDERVILRSLSRCSWYVDCIPGWTVIVFDLLLHVPVVDPPIPVQYPQKYSSSINDSRKSLAGKPNLDGWLSFRVRTPFISSRTSPNVSCCSLCIWSKIFMIPSKVSVRRGGRLSTYPRISTVSVCVQHFSTPPDVAAMAQLILMLLWLDVHEVPLIFF